MVNTYPGRLPYRQILALLAVIGLLTVVPSGSVQAAGVINSCTSYCHGIPPLDSPVRRANVTVSATNPSTTAGVVGSHGAHVKTATTSACTICHTPVAPTSYGHQNGRIAMANSLRGYSSSTARARYNKGVFFNQTSIPSTSTATCSSVSCHFENTTPAWGSGPLVDCNACHGFPPAGGSTGTAGSHGRHAVYYQTQYGCQNCHFMHFDFSHATSAGRRPLSVQLEDSGAAYSGSGTNYLPSQSAAQLFGNCSATYCHSNGTSLTTPPANTTVTWGTTGPLACSACHSYPPAYPSGSPKANSHAGHTQAGVAYSCDVCHNAVTSDGNTIATVGNHVNRSYNVDANPAKTGAFSYSYNAAGGTCSATYCHGAAIKTWGANTAVTQCEKCHGSATTATAGSFAITAGTTGSTASTLHVSHLAASHTITAAVNCSQCHSVPATVTAAGHIDSALPAEVPLNGGLATSGGLTPSYTAATKSCDNTYCHGASLPASNPARTTPSWNATILNGAAPVLGDGVAVSAGGANPGSGDCAKCHGYPPQNGHRTSGCTSCHTNLLADNRSFVNASFHVNGAIDIQANHSYPYAGSQHKTYFNDPNSLFGSDTFIQNCGGCHEYQINSGPYPVPRGTPPICASCHNLGNNVGNHCADCHGDTATGRPFLANAAFPNNAGLHESSGFHVVDCAICHAGGGTGTPGHGNSNGIVKTRADVTIGFTNGSTVTANVQAGMSFNRNAGNVTCTGTCHSKRNGGLTHTHTTSIWQ